MGGDGRGVGGKVGVRGRMVGRQRQRARLVSFYHATWRAGNSSRF